MCHAHASSRGDVEANQTFMLIGDDDETQIVRENVDVVVWGACDGDFELFDTA